MKKYDAVIIGSGLGGLVCGYLLVKEGMRICILEKNRQFGGNLQIFSRDKSIFDTGIHYIGGLSEGQNLNQFFKYFGLMDKLKLKKLDENGFDRICFEGDDNEYPHANGYENFVAQLLPYFPNEKENLEGYCRKLQEICAVFPLYNLEVAGKDYLEKSFPFLTQSADSYIDSVTADPKLRAVLAGTVPLYAGEADKTPLYIHALIANSYIESAYKCIDGGGQIAKHLIANIQALGGEVRNYAECKQFIFSGDTVKEVELTSGECIKGNMFISNMHPAVTMDMLEAGKMRKAYINRIQSLENTISAFVLNLVLKPGTFKYQNYNTYFYRDYKVWETINYKKETWPPNYALFNPASDRSDGFADCLSIMVYMDYKEVAKWAGTFRTFPHNKEIRSEAYEAFKLEKAEKVIDLLEKKYPDIRTKIKSMNCSSPLTYRDYVATQEGSIYGISRSYKDPMKAFVHARTKVPNLLLTGQNVHIHGVLGVTIGAVLTASEIVGMKPLLDKITAV